MILLNNNWWYYQIKLNNYVNERKNDVNNSKVFEERKGDEITDYMIFKWAR